MNKREAISECKKLWGEIEESGLSKYEFLATPKGKKWIRKGYHGNCSLCEYASAGYISASCTRCPLMTQYGKRCVQFGFDDFRLSSPSFSEAVRGLK